LKSDDARLKQFGASVAVTKGGSIVDNRPSVSSLTSRYNDFLFAPICEEASGMHLSVLSALARMNVDPWEEATRLAAMPNAIAERALVSILDLVSSRCWNPSEAKVIAARLVQLLPQRSAGATSASPQIALATLRGQRARYWLVWVGFAIAISILSPHRHAGTTVAGVTKFESSASSPLNKSGSLSPNTIGQSR
jgi:hypothetical protein